MRPEQFQEIVYTVVDGAARIQLNRPEAKNALTPRMYREIKWAVRIANVDDDVDIIVLTGAGDSFCAGGDLKESLRRIQDGGVLAMHEFFDDLPYFEIRDSRKTVIAAVHGACYAGGLITALWCDLLLATESSRFALTEAKVGTADAFAPALLYHRVPTAKLKHMLFTAKPISARQAEDMGIVGEVVLDGHLKSRTEQLIADVRQTTPLGRAMYKRFINELIPRPLNHGGEDTFPSMAAAIQQTKFGGA